MKKKTLLWLSGLSLICLVFTHSIASAGELQNVQKAIAKKGAQWTAGETSASRLSATERGKRVALKKPAPTGKESILTVPPVDQVNQLASLPANLDWRDNGGNYVTPVRDQGSCKSCFAFATAGALESSALISNNAPDTDLDLSEQVLLSFGGAGSCTKGGSHNRASDFLRDSGLPLENCLPYAASNKSSSSACADWQFSALRISDWSWVATISPTVDTIKKALYNYGPLPTTMAVYADFYYYRGGVYSYTTGALKGNHGVLIVGYDDPGQYFIVKNSWGTDWGESGYFKIAYSELNSKVQFGDWTMAYGAAVGSYCDITTSPASQSMPASGGIGMVFITVSASWGCDWTATSNVSWITFPYGDSGAETGNLYYSVAPNTGATRTGIVTIADQTHTVTQAGSGNCSYSISPLNQSFSASGGPGSVNVSTSSGCSWTAVSNSNWMTITSGSRGSGNGTVNYSVSPNPNTSVRTGNMTIANQPFAVTVDAAPVAPTITSHPANVTVSAPATATFSVTATGTAPLSYQWQKNSSNISGATSSSYTTPATSTADNGAAFRCIVSNSTGSATSNAATLTVNAAPVAPTITAHPSNVTVTAPATATFSVTASGTAPLSYQWQKNSSNISGATSSSYTTAATTTSDNGAGFRCVVSNSVGSATSNAATLTVNAAAVAPTITSHPLNMTVTPGQTATFSVTAAGTAPLSYQWQKNSSNISGATSSSYTTPATTTADNGAAFRCVVSNSVGSATSNAATLTVSSVATVIWVEDAVPTGAIMSWDGGDSWNWVTVNPGPYSGATASQSNLAAGEHQHYFYNATDTLSVQTGDTLFVYVYIDPANPPEEVMVQWYYGSSDWVRAYWGTNKILWGADGTAYRRYMGVLPASGQWVRLEIPASAVGLEGTTVSGMAFTLYGGRATWDYAGKTTGGGNVQAPSITQQPANQTVTAPATATFSVTATGTAPLSYQWQKNSSNISGATSSSYTTPATTTADSGAAFRCVVSNSVGSATSNPATLMVNAAPVAPTITSHPSNVTVTAPATATFSVAATGTAPLSYQWQKNAANISGATSSSYTTPATTTADNGAAFRCVVSNSVGSATSNAATLTVNAAPVAPSITGHPANVTVTAPATATFSVSATGTAPLSYQWQKNNSNISGATSSSYTTPATSTADSGAAFRCVVSNSVGSATSNAATLTVNAAPVAPTISTHPANMTVTAPATATFSVSATGTAPLSYQWQKNNSNISGATSSSYTTPATSTADNGAAFRCVVSNSVGSATSNAATLTVSSTSPGGEALWLQSLGGSKSIDSTYGNAIAVDRLGNAFVAATYKGTVNADTSFTSNYSGYDFFVTKYSSSGAIAWAKPFGSSGTEQAYGVAVDNRDGSVVAVGSFENVMPLSASAQLNALGFIDGFVVKLDTNGQLLWGRSIGSYGSDAATSVSIDSDGSVVVTGYFSKTVDFGCSSLTSRGGVDVFVVKLSGSTGQCVWAKQIGGSLNDLPNSIASAPNRDVIVTGWFEGSADLLGVQESTVGGQDAFVVRLSGSDGSRVWEKTLGGTADDSGRGVAVDPQGNVVLVGTFAGVINSPLLGGKSLSSAGGADIFVMKLDGPTGTHLWSRSFGSSVQSADIPYAVATDGQGNIVLTGTISGPVPFGKDLLWNGSVDPDGFIAKLNSTGEPLWAKRFGGMFGDSGNGVAVDQNGNVLATGYYYQVITFGSVSRPGLATVTMFTVKLTP